MEINAKVYAMADEGELLNRAAKILEQKTFQSFHNVEILEPCAVLPLTKTWYGFSERAEPTDGTEDWMSCLRECASVLLKHGAVVVEFRSPDDPDDYLEYAYTTPAGNAGCSGRLTAFNSYDRIPGGQDFGMVLSELLSGRTARDRAFASRRKERKEAARKEKGDFEVTADGVLKKYRGKDTEVVIPDGVREIGESAFVDLKGVERMLMECEDYDAPEMEKLTIPDSVEKIGSYAFAYCLNLAEVEMADRVRFIGDRAFEGCESLKKVRLSANLTEIEDSTFFLCESLRSIEIPESVTQIGEGAFWGCSLSRVKLPENLKAIGKRAFYGCEFKRIVIPRGVEEIGEEAFPKDVKQITE